MKKRTATNGTLAKAKTPPAESRTSMRLSSEDLKLIEQLKQKTRIANTSDVIKYALGIAAEKHGITF